MLGNPKYKIGDVVQFIINTDEKDNVVCTGTICVVDKYGTFYQNTDVFYDVMVQNFNGAEDPMFVKHIEQPLLTLVSTAEDNVLDPSWRFNSTKKY